MALRVISNETAQLTTQPVRRDFVRSGSIVKKIWGDADLVLLIFAGSAAEFALNRAVDWLFFTGKLPADPIGRLFSTVRYAQGIVFGDEAEAGRTLGRINAAHRAVEVARGQSIPAWAYRDVLYMLIDYSERAHGLLFGPLSAAERAELYDVFRRVGAGLNIEELPTDYRSWQADRRRHLARDLAYGQLTEKLYAQYRRHLGEWRYRLLLEVQGLLVPEIVRRLLRLRRRTLFSALAGGYALLDGLNLRPVIRRLLMQPRYRTEVEKLDLSAAAQS
jgi:uncharacterized protein (DUF2236 family)